MMELKSTKSEDVIGCKWDNNGLYWEVVFGGKIFYWKSMNDTNNKKKSCYCTTDGLVCTEKLLLVENN